MREERDIFAELTEGFDALKSLRKGKLFALRDAARQGLIEVARPLPDAMDPVQHVQ